MPVERFVHAIFFELWLVFLRLFNGGNLWQFAEIS